MKLNNPSYLYTSNDVRIFYNTNFLKDELSPEDSVIVFIYGLVCSNDQWKFQLPFFDEKKHKILIHDFRGHFTSSGESDIENCTFKNMTQDLYELINEINARKIILVAHSMGVNIALEFSHKFPDLIQGLVLVSGTVFSPSDVILDSNISDMVIPQFKKLFKLFPRTYGFIWRNAYLISPIRTIVHRGGFHSDNVPKDFVTTYLKKVGELPPELFYQLIEEMKNHDIINYLDSIKSPTLIIGGDKDKIIPNKYQFALGQILSNSEIYIIKDGSHVPQADFPKLINERIEVFIDEITMSN